MRDKANDHMAMTSPIQSEHYFVSALPTSLWRQILWYCRAQTTWHGRLSKYTVDVQTWLTIGVQPTDYFSHNRHVLSGVFFSERFHQHTFHDIVQAVREGALDSKALTYPDLLAGEDTMVVFFWPDEGSSSNAELINDGLVHRQSEELFSELSAQAILCF